MPCFSLHTLTKICRFVFSFPRLYKQSLVTTVDGYTEGKIMKRNMRLVLQRTSSRFREAERLVQMSSWASLFQQTSIVFCGFGVLLLRTTFS